MTLDAFDDLGALPRPSKAGAKPSRPRDAATLILIQRQRDDLLVLMGRRHHGHAFMPGKWVFPGGGVDRADFSAPFATDLRPEVAARLQMTTPVRRARGLALAAIRETFEEVGLLLAKPAPRRVSAGPWGAFLGQGALPDLAALDVIARAVTPPAAARRFDARFFMADASRLMSLERQPDCGELDDIAWVSLGDALNLDLPSITRFVLRDLPSRLADPLRPAPYVRFLRGKQTLRDM